MEEKIILKMIQVHPRLIEEFNIMKIELESSTGYPIMGGNPVISLIVAEVLKKRRHKDNTNIKVEVQKVKGLKKNEILFL